MRKKGDIDVPSEDISEPRINDISTHETLVDEDVDVDHLDKTLLVDEIGDDPEEEEDDEFGMDYAMDPNGEYGM